MFDLSAMFGGPSRNLQQTPLCKQEYGYDFTLTYRQITSNHSKAENCFAYSFSDQHIQQMTSTSQDEVE